MMRKIMIACMAVISAGVQAQSPGWQVNAGQYNYSMTVVGMIKRDGVPVSNANSQVAAFINGQLRGVATPVFVPALNRSIYYLLIYSNDSGGNITFKYYDGDQNAVIGTPQTLSFVIDGLAGTPQKPFVWSNRITSNTANLTSYSLPAQYSSQIYNDTIIAISVPQNYSLSSVVTTFTTSTGASVVIGGQEVVSGDAIDYSAAVKITVRSEDEQTLKRYTVKVPTIDLALATKPLYDRSPGGTFAGKLSTTGFDAGTTPVYTFGSCSPGADNGAFSIRKDSVFIKNMARYHSQPDYDICIRATDQHGLYYEKSFHLPVQDVNFAPGNLQFAFSALHDRDPAGKFVGKLTTTDVDPLDAHTYTLGTCQSNINNASFIVRNDSVFTGTVVKYDDNSSLMLCLRTTDGGGLYYEKSFTIPVLDVNFAPTDLTFKFKPLHDYDPAGKFVGVLKAVDSDPRDTYTYTLGACNLNTGNPHFIVRNDSVFTTGVVMYTSNTSFDVCLKANDSGGLSFEKSFHVPVVDVNYAPTGMTLAAEKLYDGAAPDTFIGKLTTADQDLQDHHVYTFGTCKDNNLFAIRNDSIFTRTGIRHHDYKSLSICVVTTDEAGLFYEKTFQVTVTDVNYAPSDLSFAFRVLNDQDPAGTFVGKLATTDFDAQDVHVYSLGACLANDHNTAFVIRSDSVFTTARVLYDAVPAFAICIRSTDPDGLYVEKSYEIPVVDSHDPSDIIIETLTIEEGNPKRQLVSTMQVVDGDWNDTFTYTLVPGDGDLDNAQFHIGHDSLYMLHVAYYDVKQYYTLRVRVTDAKGAFYEKKFNVDVVENPRASQNLPSVNYVSPNDDGINDYWVVKNVEIYPDFSLHIFDQFGNVIYRKDNNYNNEWNGKRNGKPLPDGSYYYVFRNEQKVYRGNITIVNK